MNFLPLVIFTVGWGFVMEWQDKHRTTGSTRRAQALLIWWYIGMLGFLALGFHMQWAVPNIVVNVSK